MLKFCSKKAAKTDWKWAIIEAFVLSLITSRGFAYNNDENGEKSGGICAPAVFAIGMNCGVKLLGIKLGLKYFVMHFDYVTSDSLTIRVSFSNLYKSAKITQTMCQFPFVVPASKNTVDDLAGGKGQTGKSPKSTSWTMFIVDNHTLLKIHTGRQFSHLKSVQMCSHMTLKEFVQIVKLNIITGRDAYKRVYSISVISI